MMAVPPINQRLRSNVSRWLWLGLGLSLLLLIALFAKKVIQPSLLPELVSPKTAVIDPKCPTNEQKAIIEENLNKYGAGFGLWVTT